MDGGDESYVWCGIVPEIQISEKAALKCAWIPYRRGKNKILKKIKKRH